MNLRRYGVVQFCDDIRQEVGNKYSLMGCYADDLITEKLPAVFAKLCAQVKLVTPVEHPFEWLKVRAVFNGNLLAEIAISEPPKNLPPRSDGEPILQMALVAVMVFSPLQIEESGRIRIEFECEDGISQIGSLLVRQRNHDEPKLL